jgi:hypothetical protein
VIGENLRLSPEQRALNHQQVLDVALELERAGILFWHGDTPLFIHELRARRERDAGV